MAALRDHVQAHLGNPLALVDLARMAGLSPHYFLLAFRKSFGVTPHQYVLGERIREAMRLLRRDQLSISEVALSVGFADQSHFTATFRRFAGTTPRRFRQAS